MNIRHLEDRDYQPVIAVVDEWWAGRHMADMLTKMFFVHFRNTSFAVEEKGKIIGFLVGLISQSFPDQAYIHFVGIHPDFRKKGLGRNLYERFFEVAREKGCTSVRCVTSPVNAGSIAFHTRMGFQIERVTGRHQEVECALDYNGTGRHRVLFKRSLP